MFATFGLTPWITGGCICIAMFFIFPAASDRVRRSNYNLFYWSHNAFFVFFFMILLHGPVFKYWAAVPIFLYAIERFVRESGGRCVVYCNRVKWIDPVLAVYFCPRVKEEFPFKEGQYVYLCCPSLPGGANNWHPFSISSAYDDMLMKDYISVHIKVNSKGWTGRLKDLFEMMNPKKQYPFQLTHMDEKGCTQPGKFNAPNGQPLLLVDGPHAAPCQHYCKYETVMLAAAGIGLTPVASILSAVTRYKWKRGFYPELLHVYWMVPQGDIKAFQWFIQQLTEIERDLNEDRAHGLEHQARCYLEINIFVTRAQKDYLVSVLCFCASFLISRLLCRPRCIWKTKAQTPAPSRRGCSRVSS